MLQLISDLLLRHSGGLTEAQIEKSLNVTSKTLVPETLRDLHWRGRVRRLRPPNGDVVYQHRFKPVFGIP